MYAIHMMNTPTNNQEAYEHTAPSCLIIATNPNPDSLTICAAKKSYAALIQKNIPCDFHHLDTMNFSPILSQEEIARRYSFDDMTLQFQRQLSLASVLGIFFPDWWGYPPALLVGWIQRIFVPGIAFDYTGKDFLPKHHTPKLDTLKVLIAVSSDESSLQDIQVSCDILKKRVFEKCGIRTIYYSILNNTKYANTHEKNIWLDNNIKQLVDLCIADDTPAECTVARQSSFP